ncbi:hypothetical protein CHLRE_03g167500v5 [Chlamydomonas reinhardtii]|uniref:STI1/HOP DP domain-containing protein n=1 Tax=Chlamydomonas reinhardtii TaxID=3055 RepID=A8IF51_CHLRE|nr:uncharacterized protein CHLRE_03g167500v5 [Chlamydomonas reinhardtii]PNW84998.1 hypothetical protein CHLRE_03g167500v5 [Chlamydomonas reinhardtii]|eukprot:XP_001703514.1 predicted protein [Chlamydomonas reinhardtii]
MSDIDDDAPPPLSSLAEQVSALKLVGAPGADASTSGQDTPTEASLRVANVVVLPAKPAPAKAAPAIKKGFFDAPPKRRTKPAGESKPPEKAVEEIPMLRAKPKAVGSGPDIPDFMRVEPDEQAKMYDVYKSELVNKLKPTPDMVSAIGKDPELLSYFDDPEVMAAVSDVAANPAAIKKYQDKPKVKAFYAMMGKLMGEKLEKEGFPEELEKKMKQQQEQQQKQQPRRPQL